MVRSRVREHAKMLVDWAVDINSGDMVTLLASSSTHELVTALHGELGNRGAEPVTITASLDTNIGPSGSHIAEFLANHDGDFDTPRHLQALVKETIGF